MTDLVSIIMPAYNATRYIEFSIDSVLSQTYIHWELLIVDDASSDNTVDIIKKYSSKDKRIIGIFSEVNGGVAKARNKALENASGRYIAFLDSDDIWYPEKLEVQLNWMKEKTLAITFSSYDIIDKEGNRLGSNPIEYVVTYRKMLKENLIGNLTGVIDKKYFGHFSFDSIGHEDYALWLKLMRNDPSIEGMTTVLAAYRLVENSVSSNKMRAARWRWNIYRRQEKLSLLSSIYYMCLYLIKGILKRNRYYSDVE